MRRVWPRGSAGEDSDAREPATRERAPGTGRAWSLRWPETAESAALLGDKVGGVRAREQKRNFQAHLPGPAERLSVSAWRPFPLSESSGIFARPGWVTMERPPAGHILGRTQAPRTPIHGWLRTPGSLGAFLSPRPQAWVSHSVARSLVYTFPYRGQSLCSLICRKG